MATTKKVKAATKTAVLKFNPEWFTDPPPPFFKNLKPGVLREIAAAKKAFQARINEILKKGAR